MNELFVNVKVDREERPDVDAVTMEAAVGMTGSGGWPTTVFMTPDGKPFYAGTYFPPEPRHGLPSFRDVLRAVAETWRERRADVDRQADRIDEALRSVARAAPSPEPLTSSILAQATRGIARTFDPAFGGFGGAPKFPAASTLELLLRRGDDDALAMVAATLDAMAAGRHVRRRRRGLPSLLGRRPLARPALREDALRQRAARVGVPPRLGRDGACAVPRGRRGDGRLHASRASTSGRRPRVGAGRGHRRRGGPHVHVDAGRGGGCRHSGRAARAVRARPADRARRARARAAGKRPRAPARGGRSRFATTRRIASWNGLALAALSESARRLDRDDWLRAARELGEFLLGPLSTDDGRLQRSLRDGTSSGAGFLDDYANVAHGLMELHVATGEIRWLLEARRLALLAIELFADEEHGGFFLSPADGDARVPRTKDLQDTPMPSGNSMLAWVLLRLGRLWGDDELEATGRLGLPPRRAGDPAGTGSVRVGALRARSLVQPSAGDRDRRPGRLARRPRRARAVRAARGGRCRPVGGRAAAGREGPGRRQARGLRLRALRLPEARDRSRRAGGVTWTCA